MNATLEAETVTPLQPEQAVEFVRTLSGECREAVFLALLREAREHNGDRMPIPIFTEDGKDFGHITPPSWPIVYPNQNGPTFTKEQLEEIQLRVAEGIPVSDVITNLKRKVAELQRQSA